MPHFHTLTISSITQETPNAVIIAFIIPENLKENFAFKAGQYITIKHTINGEEIRRAYSICNSPKNNQLQVGVKKVDGGTFSVLVNTQLKAGDTLEVMEPTGNFILDPQENKNHFFFAAGSGITPIISLIKDVLETTSQSKVVLVFGNKSLEETMFYNEIEGLKKFYKNRFSVTYLFSRKQEEMARFGRIDRAMVNYFLKNAYAEISIESYYICGPEQMITEVSETLKENNIAEAQIKFELFTTAETSTEVSEKTEEGSTSITITVDDETETFVMQQNQSILDAALNQKLDAPYSCQGGICSTCIARLVEGKAEMRQNQILTDGEIAEGLILTCQAHPSTAKVVVDYDDV